MREGKLGIITNNQQDVFQRDVIEGIQQVATLQGYSVVVHPCSEDPQFPHALSLDLSKLAGLVVIANVLSDDLLRTLYQNGKLITLVAHQVSGLPIPGVMSNNVQGIAELVYHLVHRGQRRNLVFIRGLLGQNDGYERESTFRQEIIRHDVNMPESHFVRGDFSFDVAAASVQELIDRGDRFDGILASDYLMAIAAVETLRAARIRVPEDVAVVGFGDGPEAVAAGLTTVAASITELGACAGRQIIGQIKGGRISGTTMLSVRLITRATC